MSGDGGVFDRPASSFGVAHVSAPVEIPKDIFELVTLATDLLQPGSGDVAPPGSSAGPTAKADSAVAARATAVALGLSHLFGFKVCGQRGKHEVWIPG